VQIVRLHTPSLPPFPTPFFSVISFSSSEIWKYGNLGAVLPFVFRGFDLPQLLFDRLPPPFQPFHLSKPFLTPLWKPMAAQTLVHFPFRDDVFFSASVLPPAFRFPGVLSSSSHSHSFPLYLQFLGGENAITLPHSGPDPTSDCRAGRYFFFQCTYSGRGTYPRFSRLLF